MGISSRLSRGFALSLAQKYAEILVPSDCTLNSQVLWQHPIGLGIEYHRARTASLAVDSSSLMHHEAYAAVLAKKLQISVVYCASGHAQ